MLVFCTGISCHLLISCEMIQNNRIHKRIALRLIHCTSNSMSNHMYNSCFDLIYYFVNHIFLLGDPCIFQLFFSFVTFVFCRPQFDIYMWLMQYEVLLYSISCNVKGWCIYGLYFFLILDEINLQWLCWKLQMIEKSFLYQYHGRTMNIWLHCWCCD